MGLLGAAACSAILGYDEPTPGGGAGAGGVAGGTTNSGTGGALGGSGGTGAGASGGTGGGGAACTQIGQQDTCTTGLKCTVVDPAAGTVGCASAGTTPDFQACTANEQCGVSAWCDEPTGVCRPICVDSTSCSDTFGLGQGSTCSPTQQGGQMVLGGLKVCTAHCNPENDAPCISGDVAVTCAWRSTPNDWDCMVSGGAGEGDGCTEGWDCSPGLTCGPDGSCQPWCTGPDTCCGSCVVGFCPACRGLSPPEVYAGQTLGACYDTFDMQTPPLAC